MINTSWLKTWTETIMKRNPYQTSNSKVLEQTAQFFNNKFENKIGRKLEKRERQQRSKRVSVSDCIRGACSHTWLNSPNNWNSQQTFVFVAAQNTISFYLRVRTNSCRSQLFVWSFFTWIKSLRGLSLVLKYRCETRRRSWNLNVIIFSYCPK